MAEVGQYKNTKQVKIIISDVKKQTKRLDLENLMMYIDTSVRKFDGRFSKTKSDLMTSTKIKKPTQEPLGQMGVTVGSSGGTTGY